MVNFRAEHTALPSNFRLILTAFTFTAIFILLLCFLFDPTWETNDDVGMSMVAHGYGLAAIGSPNLIYSNVLWGYLVRLIPEVNGVLGYSIATLGVLVLVGTVLIYGLLKLGFGYIGAVSALVLILMRPVLFPQFTINAGLLMVGAIILWHLYANQNNKRWLIAGCIFAFLSYLIRNHEFMLILMVALPLLPWQMLRFRSGKIAVLVLVLGIASSALIDHQAYQGSDWKPFNNLNLVRARFTDFSAATDLKKRPDILKQYGYSANDIDLMATWFFVDPNIANPTTLNAMLDHVGLLPNQKNALVGAWEGIKTLSHPTLLPLVLAALLLAVLRPSWKVVITWGLCIGAISALGIIGRPAVLRVYLPLVSLLVIAPFLVNGAVGVVDTTHRKLRNWLISLVIIVAALFNSSTVFKEKQNFLAYAEVVRQNIKDFPSYPIVIWGGSFTFEAAYPVLKQSPSAMSHRFYGLGAFTLAPFSTATVVEKSIGLIELLKSDSGIPIIANDEHFGYLNSYCRERLRGELKEISTSHYVSRRRCEVT